MSFKSNISRYIPKSREVSQNQSPSQDAFVVKGNGSEVEQLREKVIELENDLREIAKKDQAIISDLKSQLEDAICAKADMSKKLAESYEVSKTLKEGKEELFLTVLNLNERLETQNKMTTEAQSVFLKLPAAIRALKRLDDETVVLRKEKLQQEIELENQKKISAEYERMMADMKCYNDKYGEEVKAMQGQLVDQLSAFKIVNVTLEKASAAASTKDSANYEALQKQYEESKATIDADRLIFATERGVSDEELRKLHCQLETRMHLLTLQSPKHADTQLVQTVVEEPYLRIIDDVKHRLFKSENERRILFKQLQALRGNIRVTVRCRPYINHDGVDTLALDNASQTNDSRICGGIRFFKDGTSISLAGSINVRDKPQVFGFDQVFKPESTQEEVYKSEVSGLVQSALDGFKVCIFSYGQTGSGKTFTMSGERNGALRGIMPRAVEHMISEIIVLRQNGWDVSLTTSMVQCSGYITCDDMICKGDVEIYNEEVRDLLDVTSASHSVNSEKSKLKISNLKGFVTIDGVTTLELNTSELKTGMEEFEGLSDRAAKARITKCTTMNERSSRSHALFIFDIHAQHKNGLTSLKGGLRLVDLAGSERLDRTGHNMDPTRLKETVNINKSLSCLADVFIALGNKSAHIPYRNSKLTMVLQVWRNQDDYVNPS